jgi:hypothetical protein
MITCPRCHRFVLSEGLSPPSCPSCGAGPGSAARSPASALLGLLAAGAVACAVEPDYGVVVSLDGGEVTVSPSLLELGEVAVGEEAAGEVTVQSVGERPLTLFAVGVPSGTAFTAEVPEVPTELAPGESVTVEVTFAPGEVGPASALLTVSSDDDLSPEVQVTLEGTGTP